MAKAQSTKIHEKQQDLELLPQGYLRLAVINAPEALATLPHWPQSWSCVLLLSPSSSALQEWLFIPQHHLFLLKWENSGKFRFPLCKVTRCYFEHLLEQIHCHLTE